MDNLLLAWVAVVTVSDLQVVSDFGTFDIDGFDFDMSEINHFPTRSRSCMYHIIL